MQFDRYAKKKMSGLKVAVMVVAGLLLFGGGYLLSGQLSGMGQAKQITRPDKDYYISFDDYYYEVPAKKAADDKLVPGGQFLYNVNTSIKTNTLDDLFNDGAIGVQALFPFNGDRQAFENYMTNVAKPAAASAFQGTADLTFSDRKNGDRAAELVSKDSSGQVVRRQYVVNLPQSVAVVTKNDNQEFRAIGESVGQASDKFLDYEDIKVLVLTQSNMLKGRMFEDIYRMAHEDLRNAVSAGELTTLADKSKEMFDLEAKVSGVNLNTTEMTATVHFIDQEKPLNTKVVTLSFRLANDKWQLYTIKFPSGVLTGAKS